MKKSNLVYLSVYEGDAVYEPAEGGYYVEQLHHTGERKLSFKHAKRELRRWMRVMLEDGHELLGYSSTHATFRTGAYVGDRTEFHIESTLGKHESLYHGYC